MPRKMEDICASQALLETGLVKLTETHAGLKNVEKETFECMCVHDLGNSYMYKWALF